MELFLQSLRKIKAEDIKLIIISDGDANDEKEFDVALLQKINSLNLKCKIYSIGIDQDEEAQRKSENLAVKTVGFYVNLEAINYDGTTFHNMLFELNKTIISTELSKNLNAKPKIVEDVSVTIENKRESNIIEEVKKDITVKHEIIQKDNEPLDLKKTSSRKHKIITTDNFAIG